MYLVQFSRELDLLGKKVDHWEVTIVSEYTRRHMRGIVESVKDEEDIRGCRKKERGGCPMYMMM
jgi:hypothetical protein